MADLLDRSSGHVKKEDEYDTFERGEGALGQARLEDPYVDVDHKSDATVTCEIMHYQ